MSLPQGFGTHPAAFRLSVLAPFLRFICWISVRIVREHVRGAVGTLVAPAVKMA